MGIDPLLYEKYSGRSGDPLGRKGEFLARDIKTTSEHDELPRMVRGEVYLHSGPPSFMNLVAFWRWWGYGKKGKKNAG